MNKYVVLATNDVPKYVFYLPIIMWAWSKFGWSVLWFHPMKTISAAETAAWKWVHDMGLLMKSKSKVAWFDEPQGFSTTTLAQVSRLYGSCVPGINDNDYLLTSDVDMLPLSAYWQGDPKTITSWGHNLSNEHYPICYLGMTARYWKWVMNIPESVTGYDGFHKCILLDLNSQKRISWTTDQDIITEKLDRLSPSMILIDREVDKRTGYPIGRVDRSAWTLDHKVFIDAHLPHDILTNEKSYQKVMNLLTHIWPNESFKWFEEYYRDFKKLIA